MPNPKIVLSRSVVRPPGADSADHSAWIAPAPLLPGEKESDYASLAARIVAVAQPRDFIEELLTNDVIDLSWEILRLRRLKAGMLRGAAREGVRRTLTTIDYSPGVFGGRDRDGFAAKWAGGDAAKHNELPKILARANLTMDDVMAEALSGCIDSFERLDRMLASAEARRNNALREIERHRAAFGAAVRQAVEEVQDAEYRDVEIGEEGIVSPQ
jgi:hypothetical protein